MLHRELIGGKEDHHPVAMNLNIAKGCRTCEIKRWAGQRLEPGSLAYSDGLACFSPAGQSHEQFFLMHPAVEDRTGHG